jgi:hypothetical protein
MSYLRHVFLIGLSAALVAGAANAAPPPPPAGPEFHISFTGVLLYKKIDGPNLGYKVIAPRAPSHEAYVRLAAADYDPSSTLKPSPPFECEGIQMRYVRLDSEALTIEPAAAVTDLPPLRAGTTFDRIAHLKTLAGQASEFDPDYDQDTPKPGKAETQFLMDRGSLETVVEPGYLPIMWEFWEYRNTPAGPVKTTDCRYGVCGVSGTDLTLHLRSGDTPFSLVSSRDPAGRRLVFRPAVGKNVAITIGNSRKVDILCNGMHHAKPDVDFIHTYGMVKKASRKCMPFPGMTDCRAKNRPRISMTSRGGSDCIGAQWP